MWPSTSSLRLSFAWVQYIAHRPPTQWLAYDLLPTREDNNVSFFEFLFYFTMSHHVTGRLVSSTLSPVSNTSPIVFHIAYRLPHRLSPSNSMDQTCVFICPQCGTTTSYPHREDNIISRSELLSTEILTYYLHCQYNYYTDARGSIVTVIHGNAIYTLQDSSMYSFWINNKYSHFI